MFKRKVLVVLAILIVTIVFSLLMAACGSKKSPTTTAPAAPATSTSTTKAATTSIAAVSQTALTTSQPAQTTQASIPPSTVAPVTDLAGLLSMSTKSAMKYDMVMTTNLSGTPMEMAAKVWFKGTKMKAEATASGVQAITYLDLTENTAIAYVPSQNMATRISMGQVPLSLDQTDLSGLLKFNPDMLGTETLDGKLCAVISYSSEESGSSKMWIWQEKGLPLKIEQTSPEHQMVITFKNYDFADIADSEFLLPPNVQIIDMNSLLTRPPTPSFPGN
jgi:outer membrane lipoprotein-sorting protein